ncbi:hypothetical protein SAMN05216167_13123 [Spirosoma endophyticum]|uniref:Uncharacterized protein n=1 Tax=Spirosoma endophyticum TaxID=662367 RepID=A0A1I2GD44_9BACT|nr:hypothetical protein SAMN05216167_13123 [Spirosoma endophyticum]
MEVEFGDKLLSGALNSSIMRKSGAGAKSGCLFLSSCTDSCIKGVLTVTIFLLNTASEKALLHLSGNKDDVTDE